MKLRTVTSDPAVALELGRRLAASAHRAQRPSRLTRVWNRVFNRHLPGLRTKHA